MSNETAIVGGLSVSLPNLDGIFPSDLRKFANEARGVRNVLFQLANYAESKAKAMEFRAKGNIGEAKKLEDFCERVYRALPKWARW